MKTLDLHGIKHSEVQRVVDIKNRSGRISSLKEDEDRKAREINAFDPIGHSERSNDIGQENFNIDDFIKESNNI